MIEDIQSINQLMKPQFKQSNLAAGMKRETNEWNQQLNRNWVVTECGSICGWMLLAVGLLRIEFELSSVWLPINQTSFNQTTIQSASTNQSANAASGNWSFINYS